MSASGVSTFLNVVAVAGLEPAREKSQWILSPQHLPITPYGQRKSINYLRKWCLNCRLSRHYINIQKKAIQIFCKVSIFIDCYK